MSKEEKTPETKAEEYVETEFVKEMAVEPVEVPDVTYEGELIGWAEHTPHEHEHHEHHKEDPEELVETEFVKEMAGEPTSPTRARSLAGRSICPTMKANTTNTMSTTRKIPRSSWRPSS